MAVKKKNPAAVALGRKASQKGGPARAAAMTPEQRSASARNAVHARWAKAKPAAGSETTPPTFSTSKKALHACLKRIKDAKDELRRLTEELQKIVFHRQYLNAEN